MAYEDIRNKFLPLLQRTQGHGSLSSQDPRFANAMNIAQQGAQQRAELERQLGKDLGIMRTGAALQVAAPAIGMVNPVAGGAAFGAGNQMMGLKSGNDIVKGAVVGGASVGMLNKAITGLQNSPLAHNMRQSLANRMSNKVINPVNNIEKSMTANSFNGKPMTNSPAVQEAYFKKFGASPDMTSINYNNPNAYTRAGVRGHYNNSPTPLDFTNSYKQSTINNFSNTPHIQSQTPINGVSPQLNNITNNFANTSPMNTVIQQPINNLPSTYTSANDAIQGFMNDLNTGLMNQFGANSSPMGSAGSMGSLINAENVGMQGIVTKTIPEDIGQFGMNFINKW